MKKLIALLLAALLALSGLTAALAAAYTDKDIVKKVQQALNDAGYNCGTPDGIAGKKTAAAITQYQTDKGLNVTGEIDDALLEAMGISVAQEAAQDDVTQEAGQDAEVSESTEEGASDKAFLRDFANLAYYYNLSLLYRLADMGIDIENEDIGQSAYLITQIEPAWSSTNGYYLKSDACNILYMPAEEKMTLEYSRDDVEELSFLDHAALYAFLFTAQSFFEGTPEDWAGIIAAQLGDAPTKDGVLSIAGKMFSYSGSEFCVKDWGDHEFEACRPDNYKADSWVTGDDVPALPDEVVAEMGGLPETFDEQWARYDLVEDLQSGGNVGTSCGTDHYQGGMWLKKKNDGTMYVSIHLMDDQYNNQTWVGIYDQSGKLIEKRYLDAYSSDYEK